MKGIVSKERNFWLTAVVSAFAVAAVTGCSSDKATSTPESQIVNVELKEFVVESSPEQANSGTIRFRIDNTGSVPHELVLLKTDLAEDALPLTPDGALVDEPNAGQVLGGVDEFPAGENRTAEFEVEAGNYVLICNIPSHYKAGMTATFTVK